MIGWELPPIIENNNDIMNDDDIVHIPIPQKVLLHLLSCFLIYTWWNHSQPMQTGHTSDRLSWGLLTICISSSSLHIPSYWSQYWTHTPSLSAGSSPTLMPSSSRASSLAPGDCGFNNDLDAPGDDWDIPNIDMELDDLDQASLALGQADQLCLSAEFEGRRGTKQDSQHPDAPALDDEVENRAHRLLRL